MSDYRELIVTILSFFKWNSQKRAMGNSSRSYEFMENLQITIALIGSLTSSLTGAPLTMSRGGCQWWFENAVKIFEESKSE